MTPLTLKDLLGPYSSEPWSPAELASGEHTVAAWNSLAAAAESDGLVLPINPATGCHIGGSGNGGARPKGSKVGAPGSKHQLLLALDWFDPARKLMAWVLSVRGRTAAKSIGLWFENPQWTRSWCHGQIIPPGSGKRFFVPYSDLKVHPPTCAAMLAQAEAGVDTFSFPYSTA